MRHVVHEVGLHFCQTFLPEDDIDAVDEDGKQDESEHECRNQQPGGGKDIRLAVGEVYVDDALSAWRIGGEQHLAVYGGASGGFVFAATIEFASVVGRNPEMVFRIDVMASEELLYRPVKLFIVQASVNGAEQRLIADGVHHFGEDVLLMQYPLAELLVTKLLLVLSFQTGVRGDVVVFLLGILDFLYGIADSLQFSLCPFLEFVVRGFDFPFHRGPCLVHLQIVRHACQHSSDGTVKLCLTGFYNLIEITHLRVDEPGKCQRHDAGDSPYRSFFHEANLRFMLLCILTERTLFFTFLV